MFHDKRLLVTLTMLGLSAWLSAPVRAQDATPALEPPVAARAGVWFVLSLAVRFILKNFGFDVRRMVSAYGNIFS